MNLDPDDEFKEIYSLEYLYKITKKSKIDVVSFGHLNPLQAYLLSAQNLAMFKLNQKFSI